MARRIEELPERALDAIVAALAALTFGRSLGFSLVNWDDPDTILDNPLVRHPLADGLWGLLTTARLGYPQPLTVLTQFVDLRVGGGAPWALHLTNVLLHAVNAVLLRRVIAGYGVGRVPALAAAAVFAVHPLVAEPVCWATGRKDLLAATGVLLAFLGQRALLAGPVPARAPSPAPPSRRAAWIAIVLGAIVALGAKPSAWVLPFLVAVDWLAARRRLSRAQAVALGLSALAVAALVPVAYASHRAFHGLAAPRTPGEALRFVTQHLALQTRDAALPVALAPVYRDGFPLPLGSAWGVAGVLVAAAFAAALGAAWRARVPAAFAGLAFCLLAFAPASGLVPMNRGPADAYFYLPLAGLLLAASTLVARAEAARPSTTSAVASLAVIVLAGLGALQSTIWQSSSALWRSAVDAYPDDAFTHDLLSRALALEGSPAEAAAHFERSILLSPYPPPDPNPLLALAFTYLRLGDRPCAAHWYGEAVLHYPDDLGTALRFLCADAPASLPEDAPARARATPIADAALLRLAALPAAARAVEARAILARDLAGDAVPRCALERLASRPDVGPAAEALLAGYPPRRAPPLPAAP